jgi:hypothetical protein
MVDTPGLGPGAFKSVGVQISSLAPNNNKWTVRLQVRSTGFHPVQMGSIPIRSAKQERYNMNGMGTYKGIYIAKGSDLYNALELVKKGPPRDATPAQRKEFIELPQKTFTATESRFNAMYPEADRKWFYAASKRNLNNLKV